MIKHYFKTVIRNLIRFKQFSFLNILGLSIGMAISFLIFMVVDFELNVDQRIKNVDRLYMGTYKWPTLSAPAVNSYEHKVDGIKKVSLARYYNFGGPCLFSYNDNAITAERMDVDSNFLKVFDLPIVYGSKKNALQKPTSIVINERVSKALFGNESPIGKQITFEDKYTHQKETYTVDLVIKDVRAYSSMDFDVIVHNPSIRKDKNEDQWYYIHYIKLKIGADHKKVEQAWRNAVFPFIGKENEINDPEKRPAINGLYPIKDMYFHLKDGNNRKGNLTLIYIFIGIGSLILFIACFNFINLNSSLANKRAKEIGVRKTMGSTQAMLFIQLILESIFTCLIALVFAIILMEIAFPFLHNYMDLYFDLRLFTEQREELYIIIAVTIGVGIFSGLYPAAVLSSFQPISVLKGEMNKGRKALGFRRILIVFQFVISVTIILFTIVIISQLNFIRNTDLGFDKERIAYLKLPNEAKEQSRDFVKELKESPYVEDASVGYSVPGKFGMSWGRYFEGKEVYFRGVPIDENYIDLLGIEMLEGRKFNEKDALDKKEKAIINLTGKKMLEKDSIIGAEMSGIEIIGVCNDFYNNNPARGHIPIMLQCENSDWHKQMLIVKFNSGSSIEGAEYIQNIWNTKYSQHDFDMQFLDESFNEQYHHEEVLSETFIFFATLAIFIACLGLFGLSVFMAEQRRKEIAVRKVLGAGELSILRLQTREYIILVLIANLIAWPIAYFGAKQWLKQFSYHTEIHWYFYAISLFISMAICIGTVAYISIKAARLNPVDVIKHE